ncbi:MAG TPA: hypothetical protein VF147_09515, partial [Vicinamibacterales bacterium]
AWCVESPIMMLLSAATALVRDRGSYYALRRFAILLNLLVTAGMLTLAMPAVFRVVGETLIDLPPDISHLAQRSTVILLAWPAAIGYRRFYQGILVSHHLTRRVAYGTVVRLGSMSVTAAAVALTTRLPGATIGAIALMTGVASEAVASRIMARHAVRSLKMGTGGAPAPTLGAIARFYYPLALTSVLSMALGPLVTFGLGHGRAALASLAVWPVVNSTVFLFRSGGVAYQEVAIALGGGDPANGRAVRRTGAWLGACASLALVLMAFTPLVHVWFARVSGLTPELAAFSVWPLRLLVLLPALEFVLSFQRAHWIVRRETVVVTIATAIEGAGLVVALLFAIGALDLAGAVAGALAMLFGRVAANLFLYARAR